MYRLFALAEGVQIVREIGVALVEEGVGNKYPL